MRYSKFARAIVGALLFSACLIGPAVAAAPLTATEKAAILTLAKSAPADGSYAVLDLSDDNNYLAYKALLRSHGRTEVNRPQLYRSIEDVRARHKAQKLANKTVAPATLLDNAIDHSTYQVIDLSTNDWQKLNSTALTSVDGGTHYTGVSVNLLDAAGNSIAAGEDESFENGKNFAVTTTEGTNPNPNGAVNALAVYQVVYKDGTPDTYYSQITGNYFPKQIVNTAPRITPTTPTNAYIVVCLNRANPNPPAYPMPCNYGPYPMANGINLVLPTVGTFQYYGNIDVQNGKPKNGQAILSMVGQTTGSACKLKDIGGTFFDNATVSGDTLSWSLLPADFGPVCFGNGEYYTYTLSVKVTVGSVPIWATITNAPTAVPSVSTFVIGKIQMQQGCIVEGTLVPMADGKSEKIEDIKPGDKVLGPDHQPLTVFSTSTGWDMHFVTVTDKAGDTVVLTPTHPVIRRRTTVKAEDLKVGDEVYRADGSWSPVVKISTEITPKKTVYNLFLNPIKDEPIFHPQPSNFFAGNILVGDGTLQNALGTAPQSTEAVEAHLPPEWRVDYQNYLKEKAAKDAKP